MVFRKSFKTGFRKIPPTIHRNIRSIKISRGEIPSGVCVGYVPTMGALHEGHLSLVREARSKNDIVVVSIFVNPLQFGDEKDINNYPKNVESDIKLLLDLDVDHIFAPDNNCMYTDDHVTFIDTSDFDKNIYEGEYRPGHFRGVATIITKLFNIVKPTNAYFGQKDAAQCLLVRCITKDLDMDINVEIVKTIREYDGLAMSSRNVHLTVEERKAAPIIYKSLCAARDEYNYLCNKKRVVYTFQLENIIREYLNFEPLITELQYISVDCKKSMISLEEIGSEGAIISLACKIGGVRLIDNIVLC